MLDGAAPTWQNIHSFCVFGATLSTSPSLVSRFRQSPRLPLFLLPPTRSPEDNEGAVIRFLANTHTHTACTIDLPTSTKP